MDGGSGRGSGGGGGKSTPPVKKLAKFDVFQNPSFSAALTARSLQPTKSELVAIFSFSSISGFALLYVFSRGNDLIGKMGLTNLPLEAAYILSKAVQTLVGLVFIGSLIAVFKAISLWIGKDANGVPIKCFSKENKDKLSPLTSRQLGLLGIKPKVESVVTESPKKPPKSKPKKSSSDILVPIHQHATSSNRKSIVSSGSKLGSFSTPIKTQTSPSSLYLVPGAGSPLTLSHSSPGIDSAVSTPWSSKRGSSTKRIQTEEQLEQFLAEVDEKIIESAGRLGTPTSTVRVFGVASPNGVVSPSNASGAARSAPLRSVRMSPGSQKFTPPKRGEGDLPPPMSIEEAINAFKNLHIYPEIEQWRDCLRQWFSSVLLNPLLNKIETSHIQVMQTAAKLGISVTISQVGNDSAASATVPPDRNEWQPAYTMNEDNLLQLLCFNLMQSLDASKTKFPLTTPQQSPQQSAMIPIMQECLDAVTEHQRLRVLLKGELVECLLPHSRVPEDYMVERIRDLAEGTCVKNYESMGGEEVYNKKKKWTPDCPTDPQLLLYLFCAFLQHPKWMLHMDPASYAGEHSSTTPLFLGALHPKERFPEKYISVISTVPSILHPGASILVVGKQSPPLFALYWDKKLQFSLQGTTALWDSILLLCYRIKMQYGGVVKGMHLGSSALNILSVFESETW